MIIWYADVLSSRHDLESPSSITRRVAEPSNRRQSAVDYSILDTCRKKNCNNREQIILALIRDQRTQLTVQPVVGHTFIDPWLSTFLLFASCMSFTYTIVVAVPGHFLLMSIIGNGGTTQYSNRSFSF